MRTIRIKCPNDKCRLELVIDHSSQGQQVRCAGCGKKFLAPPAEPPKLKRGVRSRKAS